MKKIFILLLLFVVTISCNSGDDYIGNWYNKYDNKCIITKAGNKGYMINDERHGFFLIFDDGYFYLSEEDRKNNKPALIVKDKNHMLDGKGNLFTKK